MLAVHRQALVLLLVTGCASAPLSSEPAPERHAVTSGDEAPSRVDRPASPLAKALVARLTVWTRPDGTPVLTRRCRRGPVPCRERLETLAGLIEEAAREHGLDPFLLAALAMRESGFDPSAVGRRGEAGIMQLHPRGAGRGVRYVEDAAYRASCQSRLDACQAPVLERGAKTLADAVRECGSLRAGLGAYASGRCRADLDHGAHVLEEQARLRNLARQ